MTNNRKRSESSANLRAARALVAEVIREVDAERNQVLASLYSALKWADEGAEMCNAIVDAIAFIERTH